mgnify:CR=1 FL=1
MSYTDEFIKELSKMMEVNMPSVIALGYGPISAKRLSELVASGDVVVTQRGNELHFQSNPAYAR